MSQTISKKFYRFLRTKERSKKGGKVTPAKFLENPCFSLILAVKVPKSAYMAFFMDEGTFPPFFRSFKLIYVSHIEMGNTLGHFKWRCRSDFWFEVQKSFFFDEKNGFSVVTIFGQKSLIKPFCTKIPVFGTYCQNRTWKHKKWALHCLKMHKSLCMMSWNG